MHLNRIQNLNTAQKNLQSWNNPALFIPKKGNDKMLYEINLSVRGQELKSTSKKMASNTVNEVRCHFSFEGEEWEVDVKRAVFSNDRGKRYSVVIADDTCFVPHEVLLDRGAVTVNVVGATMNGDDLVERITTYKTIIIENTQKVYTDGLNSTNPTPSEFEQFVEAVKVSASVTKVGSVSTITITDKDGTTTAEIYDGEDGSSDWEDITGKPETFPPSSHTHDDRYYTETEVEAKNYATQSWVEAKGYLTEHQSLSAYRTSASQDTIDASKQDKTDNNLETSSKTVVGAINEVNEDLSDAKEDINNLQTTKIEADDYATSDVGGTSKVSSNYGVQVVDGNLMGATRTLAQYQGGSGGIVVCKNTLENLINGGHIASRSYVDSQIGDAIGGAY